MKRLTEFAALEGLPPSRRPGWSLGAGAAYTYTYLDRFGPHRVMKLVSVEVAPRLLADERWLLRTRFPPGPRPAERSEWALHNGEHI